MNNEQSLVGMINKTLSVLEEMFGLGKKTPNLNDIFSIMQDLKQLFDEYSTINTKECGRIVINRYIKLINLLLKIETNENHRLEYYNHLENAYKLGARVSLEHFIIYYEWEWNKEDKLLENRYSILHSYVYYLNKMCFDRSFEGIIANLPSRLWKIKGL